MIRPRFLVLGILALVAYVASEYLRRTLPQPPEAQAGYRLYWFFDHVFLAGKMLVLAAMAFAPARPQWNVRFLVMGGAVLLMAGSFLQLDHPLFLVACGFCFGAALKLAEGSDKLYIVMAIGGLGLGVPLNGFTGLLAAKAGFQPELMRQLFSSTLGIGSVSIATAFAGIYLLASKFLAPASFR